MLSERFYLMALQSLPTTEGTTPQALLEYAGNANLGANICVHHYQFILKLQHQTPAKFRQSDFQT